MASKRDHEFVPVHELLSESEANKVLKELGVGTANMPKIPATDAQVVKLGGKPGQLIRIHRAEDGKEYMYYRYIVKG